jgi:hypothetical protein
VAEKRPVRIAPSDPETSGLWDDLGRLAARVLPADWTLIGGLMVQLHAYEAGEMGVRVTTDIDIPTDAGRCPHNPDSGRQSGARDRGGSSINHFVCTFEGVDHPTRTACLSPTRRPGLTW